MFFEDDDLNAASRELEDILPHLAYAVGIVGSIVLGWWLAS